MSAQARDRRRRQKADKYRGQILATKVQDMPPVVCRCSHQELLHTPACTKPACGCLVYRERTEEDGCCRD